MPETDTQLIDSANETALTLPMTEECCQAPCDPPWRKHASCLTFTETKTLVVELPPSRTSDFGRGEVLISVTYEHRLCLAGKQHGGLAYTLTLLPGEKMTIYQSERFRRTTSETARVSVQTTFAQFLSAVHQQRHNDDSSALTEVMDSTSGNSAHAGGLGGILSLGLLGGVSAGTHSTNHSTVNDLATHTSSEQFVSVAEQASLYTDMQRSVTVSTFEDSEKVNTTQRTLTNNNACYAVNYFVRKVLDVYKLSTVVIAITFMIKASKYSSPVLTPNELDQLPEEIRKEIEIILKDLPKVGEVVDHPRVLTVPTDGLVFDPELEQAALIKLERERSEARKARLEAELLELEVERRKALLAGGNLDAFKLTPDPVTAGA